MKITLTQTELLCGASCGVARRLTAIANNYEDAIHADPSERWNVDIDGACAEMALAKHFGIYWEPTNKAFKAPDLKDLQIRSTGHKNGHLIVRPADQDLHRAYVLVVADAPVFTLCGWMLCRDARNDKYWRTDSWWVPQSDLKPISTLHQ